MGNGRFEINTILYTKDGRNVGNAIIVERKGKQHRLKTDYGNTLILSYNEINELFYIKKENDLSEIPLLEHKYKVIL